ncbi:MAG: Crp/Fnr family transcriptional regulator [Chloroflexi bacterium]|nr:Crp/Fnr family transcriptional regulator [Chloroflexota bacterium]
MVTSEGTVLSMDFSPRDKSMSDIVSLLARVPYFRSQAIEVIEALAESSRRATFEARAAIFLEGNPVYGLYIIEKGVVKISRTSKDGREYILHILYPGDTFNGVAAIDGGPNPATATAYSDVVVWCIRRPDLRRLANRYPALSWALVESISRRARHLLGVVEDLAMRNVRGRLAHLLLEEVESRDAQAVPRMMTQEEMAGRLGTVREVVGRALRGLTADGIIEFDRHNIVILDLERLREEADV